MTTKGKLRGKKSRLQKEPGLIEAIGATLQAGHYAHVACQIVGVKEASYYAWLERGEAAIATRRAGGHLNAREALYAEWAETIASASAAAEARAVQVVVDAMPTDARHAEWFLERRYPRRWGRFDRVETNERQEVDPIAAAALADGNVRALIDDLIDAISCNEPGGSGSSG